MDPSLSPGNVKMVVYDNYMVDPHFLSFPKKVKVGTIFSERLSPHFRYHRNFDEIVVLFLFGDFMSFLPKRPTKKRIPKLLSPVI